MIPENQSQYDVPLLGILLVVLWIEQRVLIVYTSTAEHKFYVDAMAPAEKYLIWL